MNGFLGRRQNQALLDAINRAWEDGLDDDERIWLAAVSRHQHRMTEDEWNTDKSSPAGSSLEPRDIE